MNQEGKIVQGLAWKVLERFGVQGIQFVLQIILARMLSPEDYGILSMMVVFTALANVFIQSGLNMALIQNRHVIIDDYSTVFWINLIISGILYLLLFVSAPLIAKFYDMPAIIAPFRVLCLMLFPGALNSIQIAKVRRNMDFKKVFQCNLVAMLMSGVIGIVMAYLGMGIWALVIQTLLNIAVASMVMWFTVDFRPKFVFSHERVKALFPFGWKLTASGLLDTFYQDIRSLVVGKKYSTDTLGYYNRGKQFPQFMISAVNSAVQSVLLPAMSAEQDDKKKVKLLMRNSVMLSAYIIFPLMAGLAGVAAPLVSILLTDKWLPCVPYMQIYCFALAFTPVHTSNLQAINAIGRSDLFLKMELIKKGYGMLAIMIAVMCFDTPIAIALTGIITALISCVVNALPSRKLFDYSFTDQMRDVLPSLLVASVMCMVILAIQLLDWSPIAVLCVQVIAGVSLYITISAVFKLKPYILLLEMLKKKLWKKAW